MKGVDMIEKLQVLPADRAFNWIDSMLIEDLVYISKDEDAIAKLRGQWDKLYDRVDYDRLNNEFVSSEYYDGKEEKPADFIPGDYIVPTDEGYPGLREAPLG